MRSSRLARIASRYDVAIEEVLSFEIDPPALSLEERLTQVHVSESDGFGLVWLEAVELEALAVMRANEPSSRL